jgi:nucleoid-associated protein YgaU
MHIALPRAERAQIGERLGARGKETLMRRLFIIVLMIFLSATLFGGERHSRGFWHRVKWGETLSSIAVKYGTDLRVLAKVNHIKNIDRIRANRKLWIPGFKLVRARVYVVKKGDYLLAIAKKFNADVWSIASVNGLFDLNLVFPGQRIYIPLERL